MLFYRTHRRLTQAENLVVLGVHRDFVVRRSRGQARNRRERADERDEETSTRAQADVADGQREPARRTLQRLVVREGVLRLGHANRQIAEALLGEELDLFFGSFRELNTVAICRFAWPRRSTPSLTTNR